MHRLLQLTLDLFDPAPHTAPFSPQRSSGGRVRPAPPRRVGTGSRALVPAGAATTDLLEGIDPPGAYRHPQATRELLLGDTPVAFELRRARRRNIGFLVGAQGLTVTAPVWVTLTEIDAAVRSKSRWILCKLEAANQRQQRVESARIRWCDGATFPYLGEPLIVVIDPRHALGGAGARLHTDSTTLPGMPRLTLHVGLPQAASEAQIRDAVQAWLMREAKRLFAERLDHFAPKLSVRWRKLALSSAGTRWGTAHSDGTIRLNWRLIHFGLPVIDYVVAHELSHLRVMDHSPRFWDTVRTVVPDYAQLRGRLRDEALPPW